MQEQPLAFQIGSRVSTSGFICPHYGLNKQILAGRDPFVSARRGAPSLPEPTQITLASQIRLAPFKHQTHF